jgi:hypothetical protein
MKAYTTTITVLLSFLFTAVLVSALLLSIDMRGKQDLTDGKEFARELALKSCVNELMRDLRKYPGFRSSIFINPFPSSLSINNPLNYPVYQPLSLVKNGYSCDLVEFQGGSMTDITANVYLSHPGDLFFTEITIHLATAYADPTVNYINHYTGNAVNLYDNGAHAVRIDPVPFVNNILNPTPSLLYTIPTSNPPKAYLSITDVQTVPIGQCAMDIIYYDSSYTQLSLKDRVTLDSNNTIGLYRRISKPYNNAAYVGYWTSCTSSQKFYTLYD